MSSENKQGCVSLLIICNTSSLYTLKLQALPFGGSWFCENRIQNQNQKSGSLLRKVIQNSPAHLPRRFFLFFSVPFCLFCFIPMSLNLTRRNFSCGKGGVFPFLGLIRRQMDPSFKKCTDFQYCRNMQLPKCKTSDKNY